MKLSALKINSAALEQGRWVGDIPEMGQVRLRVRGLGNSDYRALMDRLIDSVPREERIRGLSPAKQDECVAICLRDTVLVDWDGFQNEDGTPMPFDKEMAGQMLLDPDFQRFNRAVQWAANVVAIESEVDTKDAVGKR